ncbi:MAG: hypothetical protein JXA96_05145, partial [Sedimentisphaerales bacterium]|nr:hypothetical protein [Sedimentisphaerales bacterium]
IDIGDWRIGNERKTITRITKTDSQGIFKIENLPDVGTIRLDYGGSRQPLLFFSREIPEDYPEIDKVVMYKVPIFTGKVIDAQTEKPITKFRLTSGIKSSNFNNDGAVRWSTHYKDTITSEEGKFSYRWSGFAISYPFDGQCELKIEADGYLYETAPPITLGQQYEPAVIRMTKGEPFSGTITDSENKPIPGAEVGWIGPDSKAFINNGKFDQRGLVEQTQVIVKTDINGQFELPPSRNEGLIVVVHENKGYASISSEDFENGSKIQLNPWAKIEGTIISSDETRKEYTVLINTAISDEELSAQKIYWMFDGTSYSQKDFVINYVPPVPVYICQYIDSERMKREYLEPQPGQTYKVELSDEPAIISGRIIEPDSLEGKELPKMNDIEINSDNEPTDNSMNLICFWDFEQRPSRNMITQLSKRIQELEEKGILVLTINTSDTEQKVLDDWLKEQNINLKVGKITADIEKTKFNWGVKSLPWLILTDKNHIVIAEGFNLEDLNEKISSINKENNKASDVMASFQKQLAMIRGTTSNPDTTSKISDNGPKAVIKGKYISKHNDLDLGNQEIFVITTYPERSQRKINTLEDGSFIIPDIPANAYGYLSIRIMNGFYPIVTFPDKYSFFSKNESSIYFDNIPAGTYESIEYDFLKLGHVSGQVTDCNDKPLKGLWIRTQLGSRIWKTDDYGEFFIEAMPNEDLILNVTRDGYSGKLFSGNKFRIKEGEEIVKNVKLSEEMSIKIEEIIAEENRIFDTELTGKVVTKDGKPVSGAKVFLGNTYITMDYSSDNMSGKRAKPTWEQGYFWAANVESRPDGSFKFNKLIPGKSDIWAEHPELGWGYLRNVSTDSKDVKLVLEPQPEKIKYTGKVVDSENKPSANAKIYLFIDQGKTLVEQTQSKADGSFEFEFKPPWTNFRYFVLLCISEDQQPAWTSLPYCSIEDIQIKLKSTSRILGKVVDSKGKGIANAVVQYYCADDPDYGMIMFSNKIESVVPTTKTDNQGNYVMENVPLGSTVSFEAKHPTHVSDCVWYIPVIGKEVKGDNIEMDDGAIIEGTVRYANTNEPAKNVRVIARTLGTTYRQVITDNDDKYIIEGLDRLSTSDKSVILAESMESPPEWEGQTYLKRDIRDGLHLTNVDVLLQNSFLSQKQNWLARRGKIVDGPKMIVLDNCFSPTSGKTKYEDTLTMFNSNGKEQWQCSSLNISQSTGPNKSIVYNPVDKSIWCAERVGDRLIKMDLNGNILLELEDIKPNSLAVDPKTGNVWVLTIDGLVYGDKLLIFDLSGKKIKELYHNAFNITYSKKEDCFWIVGQEIIKLNRNGEDLMYWPGKFSFISVSVSINENDGSAWIVERGHPQAPPLGSQPSQDCIWIIEPNGDVRKKIKIELPMNAIVDSQRSVVWVTTYNGVFKMSLDGEILESIPVKGFDLCIEPETGYVWVTSNDGIYRLDSDGKLVWSKETAGGSQKWLCAIPN